MSSTKTNQLAALLEGMSPADRESLIASVGVEVVSNVPVVDRIDDYKGNAMLQVTEPNKRPWKISVSNFETRFITGHADLVTAYKKCVG